MNRAVVDRQMLDSQFLLVFGLIVAFAAFSQGFMGLGFGIITIAGLGFMPWDLERATVIINLLLIVLNCTIIYAGRKDFRINWKLVGVILAGLSLPSVFGAMADRRSPRVALLVIAIGAGLIALAVSQAPGRYTFAEIPHAFVRVLAYFVR